MDVQGSWWFAPTHGGVEYIDDSSSPHFRDNPISKLVREMLQNSLDVKEEGVVEPVKVHFGECVLSLDDVGGTELRTHIESCLQAAKEGEHQTVQQQYIQAAKAISAPDLPCLKIVDSNTTGAKGKHWTSLVEKEGSVSKNAPSPGGSWGIGKNAILNVSDLRTVFYSTRFLDPDPKRGRVDWLKGKATLMAHPDPTNAGRMLQHVGFWGRREGDKAMPLEGAAIPPVFQLDAIGTGVFVLGFNPKRDNWVRETVRAVVENFFVAIHQRQLVVTVADLNAEPVLVNNETVASLFEESSADQERSYFYRALTESAATEHLTSKIGGRGQLKVRVLFKEKAPRRFAYVTHNGMLVTDVREQRSNPLCPKASPLWPNYAVVVSPATGDLDQWIRPLENPSHDSLSVDQLLEEQERRDAREWFKKAREEIADIVAEQANLDRFGESDNIDELRELLPAEFDESIAGNTLLQPRERDTRRLPPEIPVERFGEPISSPPHPPDPPKPPDPNPPDPPHPPRPPRPEPPGPGPSRAQPLRLARPRIVQKAENEVVLGFTPLQRDLGQIQLTLRPAGGEWKGREDPIIIREVNVESPGGLDATCFEGKIELAPETTERVFLRVKTENPVAGLALVVGAAKVES